MPIVGTTTTVSGNVSDWSHSTIFATNISTYQLENVPALTTFWTPSAACSNRWMADLVTAVGTTVVALRESEAQPTTIVSTASAPQPIPIVSAQALAQRATTDKTFLPVISTTDVGKGTPSSGVFVAFSTNPRNTSTGAVYDASYLPCQPYGVQKHYSPGICPDGQTIAEITEYHYPTAGSTATRYEASCCQSGLAFGAGWESACIGNVTSPLRIFAPFTTHIDGENITSYEYVGRVFITETYGTDGYSTSTFSNISTVTSGLIGADPVVVGFQESDLQSFPAEYVSSLAKRYNRSWTATAAGSAPSDARTGAGSPSQPPETDPPSSSTNNPGMSTGAKAGIGVGVAIGAIAVAILGALMLMKRKRKLRPQNAQDGVPEMEDRDEVLSSKKWYLFGKWRNELPAENQRQELDPKGIHVVNQVPVELAAVEHPQELAPNAEDSAQRQ